MKIVLFATGSATAQYGLLTSQGIALFDDLLDGDTPQDRLQHLIDSFDTLRPRLADVAATASPVPLDSGRLLPPVPWPGKILIILFALPVAVGGAIAALWAFGNSFSIFALIGLILLVGLAIKNGILLVDRTNRNRALGMPVREALLEAGPARLRPILMTSLTITVALAPSALRLGEGADLRAPLAAAVLGGVISSTALTLFVVPVVYALLKRLALAHRLRRPPEVPFPRRAFRRLAPRRAA